MILEPVDDFVPLRTDEKGNIIRPPGSTFTAQTKADGSFLIDEVPAGEYFIVAELPGYLSPLTEFTDDQLYQLDEEKVKQLRGMLRQVGVANRQMTRADLRLERGAVISGTVTYDDGSTVAGVNVRVLRKEKDDSWKLVSQLAQSRLSGIIKTDDRGRYRISMLRPGEYVVQVELRPGIKGSTFNGSLFFSGDYSYSFPESTFTRVYSGDTPRLPEAKAITVRGNDERSGVDIIVPLTKLYSISGTVVAESDGHIVDKAVVSLRDVKSDSVLYKQPLNGRFTIENVPDGSYVFMVTEANDGVLETSSSDGHVTDSRWVAKRHYADTEIPLDIHKNLSAVAVKVRERVTEDNHTADSVNH